MQYMNQNNITIYKTVDNINATTFNNFTATVKLFYNDQICLKINDHTKIQKRFDFMSFIKSKKKKISFGFLPY